MKSRAAAAGAALLSIMLAGVSLAVPLTAVADATPQCLIANPGVRIPVLFVHGFLSTAATWDEDVAALNGTGKYASAPGATSAYVAAAFAYGNNVDNPSADKALSDHWVTDPGIGHTLAEQVACVAAASQRQGGPGKVVLVGHSMGGLAIRCALDPGCNDAGRGAIKGLAAKTSEVITFGTPGLGSYLRGGPVRSAAETAVGDVLVAACRVQQIQTASVRVSQLCDTLRSFATSDAARAFTYGSPQLTALPDVPASVPRLSVAGRIQVTTSMGSLWHRTLAGDAGDTAVGTTSALDGGRRLGSLGGTRVEDCGDLDLSQSAALIPGPVGAGLFVADLLAPLVCVHTDETHDAGFRGDLLSDLGHLPRGRWTERSLRMTGRSLGAVTTSMTLTQASRASGAPFLGSGDGAYNNRIPNVGLTLGAPLCLGAGSREPGGPTVTTADGFTIGDTLARLKDVYGTRLHYTAGRRSTGGYYNKGDVLDAGYWVADNDAYILFFTNGSTPTARVVGAATRTHQPPAYSGCGPPN